VENWIRSLKTLDELPLKSILPEHGPVYPHEHIQAVAGHLEILRGAALSSIGRLPKGELKDMDADKTNALLSGFLKQRRHERSRYM